MTIRSVIKLIIKPGARETFEAAFLKSGMLTRPKDLDPGFSGELLRAIGEPETYFVVATWTDRAAYAEWQRTSREGADAEALAALEEVMVDAVPGLACEVVARG